MFRTLVSTVYVLLLSACLPGGAQNSNPSAQSPTPVPAPPAAVSQETSSTPPDSVRLEVIDAPKPEYPLEAAAKKLEGRVVIMLQIAESGDVESTEIVSGEPILAQAAAATMKEWKFKPFIRNGRPAKIKYRMPFEFSLKGNFPNGCAAAEAAFVANARANAARYREVSARLLEGRLIHRVEPAYPAIARAMHVQGTVLLYAVIGEDGLIHDLKSICGPQQLVPAALDAVRQWRYRPYELDGKPVAVQTTVRVQFHM